MKKPDMSPEAVTARLKAVGELRRLCLALGRRAVAGRPAEEHGAREMGRDDRRMSAKGSDENA
jgi:hypothetical protein